MLLNRTNEGEVTDLEVSVSIQIKRMMIEQKAKKDLKQKYVVAQVVVPLFSRIYNYIHTYGMELAYVFVYPQPPKVFEPQSLTRTGIYGHVCNF